MLVAEILNDFFSYVTTKYGVEHKTEYKAAWCREYNHGEGFNQDIDDEMIVLASQAIGDTDDHLRP